MTYEEFCKQYVEIIKAGCTLNLPLSERIILGEAYADLVEDYPEYEERADLDDSIWK